MACFDKPELESLMEEWQRLMRQGSEACGSKEWRAAEKKYNQALFVAQTIDEIYPGLALSNPTVPNTLSTLAHLFREWGKYQDAQQMYEHELEYWRRLLGSDHPFMASMHEKLGEFHIAQGKNDEAASAYERAINIRENYSEDASLELAHCLEALAAIKVSQGMFPEAEKLYETALKDKKRALGGDHPAVASTLFKLASIHRCQGDVHEADSLASQARAIWSSRSKAPIMAK